MRKRGLRNRVVRNVNLLNAGEDGELELPFSLAKERSFRYVFDCRKSPRKNALSAASSTAYY